MSEKYIRSKAAIEGLPSAQTEPICINLNEPIKVKLTDWGKEIYYHKHDMVNQIAGREICKPSFPKEDEEIQVGDEIEAVSGKAVVVYVDEHKVRYVYSNGVYAFDYIDKVAKTGRHFPEIAEVLQKMMEGQEQ